MMETPRIEFPPDCQSSSVLAHGCFLNTADTARQWARRLPWAALRRARRLAVYFFGRTDKVTRSARATIADRATPVAESTEPFQAGDEVEVLSYEEICATLDDERKCEGLELMEGMKRFCGERLIVFKKVEMLFDEKAGHMLKIKRERYVLEGAICDGRGTTSREGCDRCCFFFWGRPWLRKAR